MPKRTQEQIDHCNHMIDVISHWRDGGDVERVYRPQDNYGWKLDKTLKWDDQRYKYRKAVTPITIDNWDLLPEWVQWVARDECDVIEGFKEEPHLFDDHVGGYLISGSDKINLTPFPFVHAGTVDWKDSLIERPKGEDNES